jgi:hypothetical protein
MTEMHSFVEHRRGILEEEEGGSGESGEGGKVFDFGHYREKGS